VAGLSVCVAVLVGVVLWLALRDDEYVAPTPHGPSVQVQPAPAAALLQELTIAVRRGDGEAAAALAPTDDEGAQNALRAFAENADKIPLRDLTLRYLDALGGVDDRGVAGGRDPSVPVQRGRVGGDDRDRGPVREQ
jgi:hypothetical protein